MSACFVSAPTHDHLAELHIIAKPGGQSMLAAGSWRLGKNKLDTIRSRIKRNLRRLRSLLKDPSFIEPFGQPKPGKRSSIFGRDDELKNAPKDVAKGHKCVARFTVSPSQQCSYVCVETWIC